MVAGCRIIVVFPYLCFEIIIIGRFLEKEFCVRVSTQPLYKGDLETWTHLVPLSPHYLAHKIMFPPAISGKAENGLHTFAQGEAEAETDHVLHNPAMHARHAI